MITPLQMHVTLATADTTPAAAPVSAPTNVGSFDVTHDSAVLRWSPIPEDDLRGFLLGYVIRYVRSQHGGAHGGAHAGRSKSRTTVHRQGVCSGPGGRSQTRSLQEFKIVLFSNQKRLNF